MFLSARIVDKFIAGGIVMSLFHGLGGSTNIKEQTQLAGGGMALLGKGDSSRRMAGVGCSWKDA